MKKIYFITYLLSLIFFACQSENWKEELDYLKEKLSFQAQLIEQIQKGKTIKNIDPIEEGYKITFSDDHSLIIKNSKNADFIFPSANGYWQINDENTNISCEDSVAPIIETGNNGKWWINGIDTNISYPMIEKIEYPMLICIVKTQSSFIFHFSNKSVLKIKITPKPFICTWGDSLTAGAGAPEGASYPDVLQELLGENYQVINNGVGGENTLTIAARQGGIPMLLAKSVTLTTDGTPVIIGDRHNSGLISSWNNKIVFPLLQGGENTINTCIIDGHECILKWTGNHYSDENGRYTLQHATPEDNNTITLQQGTLIFTSSMKKYRNNFANVFFIGQNLGYSSNEELIAQYKAVINFSACKNYVVLGLTSKSASERGELEEMMRKEFGAYYINLREYLSTQGLTDAGISPTLADLEAMAIGACPPSLLNDHVHFNTIGYKLIGKLIYKHFFYLGIL